MFHCFRTIVEDIDAIEIPFRSTKGEGVIVLNLTPRFPREEPVASVVWKESEPTQSPVKTDFDWGKPNVRLVTVASNIWYRLGCVDSPRKASHRTVSPQRSPQQSARAMADHQDSLLGDQDILSVLPPNSGNRRNRDDGVRSPVRAFQRPTINLEWVEEFVSTLSDQDVEEAVTSSSKFERILSDIGIATGHLNRLRQSWQASSVREANIELARENARIAGELQNLNNQLAILRTENESKLRDYGTKNQQMESCRSGLGPENFIKQLNESVDHFKKKGEAEARSLRSSKAPTDSQFKQYCGTLTSYKIREKKLKWAREDIPLPRSNP